MLSAPDDFPFISFCFAWNTNVEPPPDVKLFVKIAGGVKTNLSCDGCGALKKRDLKLLTNLVLYLNVKIDTYQKRFLTA